MTALAPFESAPMKQGKRNVSPLRWLGGKFLLARKIARLMPAMPYYCEPFCGACHLLFARAPAAKGECINDINGELMNFWRVLARDPQALIERCKWTLHSRQLFNEYVGMSHEEVGRLSPEERAWRFFYINRTCFGARLSTRPSFGIRKGYHAMPHTWAARLEQAARRMQEVYIECLPWEKFIERADSQETFFYLDPPYYGFESDYGKGLFAREDFARLAMWLRDLRGRFFLSINDCAETRAIFADFALLAELDVTYSVNKDQTAQRKELLYANFEPGSESHV